MRLPAPIVNPQPGTDYRGFGVYRLLADDGRAVYIGQTRRLEKRTWDHARTQPWWPAVVGIEWTPTGTRLEALDLERDWIARDQPPHNLNGKTGSRLTPEELAEIDEIRARAQRCRGTHAVGSPERVASERLSAILASAKKRGVLDRDLAEAAGVGIGAVRARLRRHGYAEPTPSEVRYMSRRRDPGPGPECRFGHARTEENTRFVNGDRARPVCRICERRRVNAYQARKRAAQAA